MNPTGVLASLIRKNADCEMNLYSRRVTKIAHLENTTGSIKPVFLIQVLSGVLSACMKRTQISH